MLIPLKDLLAKYSLSPNGVIHVGAHFGQEHEDYVKCGIKWFVYVEPCKNSFDVLKNKIFPGNLPWVENLKSEQVYDLQKQFMLFNYACGSQEGVMPMYVSHQNQGQSNSLLKPLLHLEQHPEIVFDDAEAVKVVPLDDLPIAKEDYDMLVLDVQGFEGEVLKGATKTLKKVKIIYTEVNRGQTYQGNMEIEEMDTFLAGHGFERVETYWPSPNLTWGDACFIRKTL